MVVQPPARIGGQARIEVGSRINVLEDVDEVFVASHGDGRSNRDAVSRLWECGENAGTIKLPSQFLPALSEKTLEDIASVEARLRASRYGAASFAGLAEPKLTLRLLFSRERRMVDLNSASWNRILSWLGEVDRVRLAAA